MTESATAPEVRTFSASDGYPLKIAVWPPTRPAKGQVVVLHGVQSHSGWYHRLGRTLASSGYLASFPDRRGSGANQADRGHARVGRPSDPGPRRMGPGLACGESRVADHDGRDQLGGEARGDRRGAASRAGRTPSRSVCPGLLPRVGVSGKEKLQIAWSFLTNPRRTFPIPLSDPALFTANPEGQAFIAADPYSLREGTAGLMAASFVIDRLVGRAAHRIRQPATLDAGRPGSHHR